MAGVLPPLGEGSLGQVLVAEGEEVEGDEARRGLLGEQLDPAGSGMDAAVVARLAAALEA